MRGNNRGFHVLDGKGRFSIRIGDFLLNNQDSLMIFHFFVVLYHDLVNVDGVLS